mgnify:FL=1
MRKSRAARKRRSERRAGRKKDSDLLPKRVPLAATPRENLDVREISHWASRAVWTDRMLETLVERRLKHGKYRLTRNARWPNAYFMEEGLYSLRDSHLRFANSLPGTY